MGTLTYHGDGQSVSVNLDHRADPMHVQGSIIMSAGVAVGLPLLVEAEIRPDGEVVVRCYEWAPQGTNPYWHCNEDLLRSCGTVPTDAQCATIWRMWAGRHPFRSVHGNGVGASLLRLTGLRAEDASARYLGGETPALA